MSSSVLADRSLRRRAIAFVVLVIACLGLVAVSDSGPVRELRRGIGFAFAPVQGSLSDATRSVTRVFGALAEIDSLRHENVALRSRVDVLEDEIALLESVRDENERLAALLKTDKALGRATVAAEVTVRHASQFERVVTLDRGDEAGIEVGDPVVSEGGALVGSVIDVGQGHSTVQLINDTRSLVTGLDSRTRATGDVVGRLAAPLAMGKIPVTERIEVGDAVVTAGLDLGRRFRSSYPKNLPIGRVVDVQQEPGEIVQTALVEPAADLDRLELVLVITDHKGPVRRRGETDEGS